MKKVLFLIFASLLVLSACGQDGDKSNKDEDKKSEAKSDKKSNDPKKDKKANNKKDTSDNNKQSNSDETTDNESQSISKNDNGKSQDNNGNDERTQGKQATQQQQSGNQQTQNNNGYMTQEEINEWNKTKPTTHNESQMEQVPQDHSGGHPSAFGKSDVPVGTQKTDSNGDTYIDATGK